MSFTKRSWKCPSVPECSLIFLIRLHRGNKVLKKGQKKKRCALVLMKLAHVPIHLKRELFFVKNSMKPLDLQRVKKWIRSREDRPALSSTIPEQRRPSCLFSGFYLSGYRTHGRLNKASSETERLHLRWEVHIDPECLKETKRLSQYAAKCCTNVFYMAESASGGGKMK